jgi:hypothetical protein
MMKVALETNTATNKNNGLNQMKKKLNECCKEPYKVIFIDLNKCLSLMELK